MPTVPNEGGGMSQPGGTDSYIWPGRILGGIGCKVIFIGLAISNG